MKDPLKLGLTILAVVILGGLALKFVFSAVSFVWGLVVPIGIIAGIALVVYAVVSRKALGGKRNSLP